MMSKTRLHWRATVAAAAVILGAASSAGAQKADASKSTAKGKTTHAPSHFRVIAPDLESKGRITLAHVFNGMGCNGQNISPALQAQRAGRNEIVRRYGERFRSCRRVEPLQR